MKYLFVLGRDPKLSRAEIESYLEARKKEYKIVDSSKDILVLEIESLKEGMIDELGGTIKIAKIICSEVHLEEVEYSLKHQELYFGKKNKVNYSVTGYNTELDSFLKDYLKDYFKEIKVKAMLRGDVAPGKLSQKEDFLDFIIFRKHIAKTIMVSNIEELKKRDIGRPSVDFLKTTSLRLAKMLVNLSGAKEGTKFLDPFCGSGSIVQEALLLGCRAIGADKDPATIKQARQNLTWLKEHYPLKHNYELFMMNAGKLTLVVKKMSIGAVATEPYMGPFIKKLPTSEEARQLIEELSKLYLSVLRQLSQLIKQQKKVVMIFPHFRTRDGKKFFINIEQMAENTGFEVLETFSYSTQKSKIMREIYIMKKV